MKLIDRLLLFLIAGVVIFSLLRRRQKHKKGEGCCGSCCSCEKCRK